MVTTTLPVLLPLLLLLLPLGAALKGEFGQSGRRYSGGHRVRTREELRRSLHVIRGGLLEAEPSADALAARPDASFGS